MKHKESAGLVLIYKDKILLVHPTGSKWFGSYSIPKGGIEKGETPLDAAIREVKEEVGIDVPLNIINKNVNSFKFKTSSYVKTVYYFIVKITELSQIGLTDTKIQKSQLQLNEVDWAGFLTYDEAKKRITKSQKDLIEKLHINSLLEFMHVDTINIKIRNKMNTIKNFDFFIKENKHSLELKKLEDAIKTLQNKIAKQGRVTNARDEDHLENLIRIYKEMGGSNIKESAIDEARLGYKPEIGSTAHKKVLTDLRADLEKIINKYESKLSDVELDQLSDFIIMINNKIKGK